MSFWKCNFKRIIVSITKKKKKVLYLILLRLKDRFPRGKYDFIRIKTNRTRGRRKNSDVVIK